MRYFTIKPNLLFWEELIKFHAKWRSKYNFSSLAREWGFSPQYISEIVRGTNHGEISTRLIATSITKSGAEFGELWKCVEVLKETNDNQVAKTQGQLISIDPSEEERNEYQITSEQQYNAYLASLDWAQRIAREKRKAA